MATKNEVVEKKQFTTSLSQWSNEITGLIARDYEACGVQFDDYSKKCALEAMTSIYTLVKNDDKVNTCFNIKQINSEIGDKYKEVLLKIINDKIGAIEYLFLL